MQKFKKVCGNRGKFQLIIIAIYLRWLLWRDLFPIDVYLK